MRYYWCILFVLCICISLVHAVARLFGHLSCFAILLDVYGGIAGSSAATGEGNFVASGQVHMLTQLMLWLSFLNKCNLCKFSLSGPIYFALQGPWSSGFISRRSIGFGWWRRWGRRTSSSSLSISIASKWWHAVAGYGPKPSLTQFCWLCILDYIVFIFLQIDFSLKKSVFGSSRMFCLAVPWRLLSWAKTLIVPG